MDNRKSTFYEAYGKRIFDILISLVTILILSPVFIILFLLVKIDSKGPAFFLQERVGKDQKIFRIIKFRTMVVNAEEIGDGIRVKNQSDSRITRIGRFLRKTSLDELPQLINVLKGDMSLIGPRPPVIYHPYRIGEYDNEKKHRFDVRPGITGLAQATLRNSVPWDGRIKKDLEYIKNVTFMRDMKIVFLTIKTVLGKENLYKEEAK